MWQARGSDTWPVPERRHHRSRRGARPMGLLLRPLKDDHASAASKRLSHVRFAPLPKKGAAPALEEMQQGQPARKRNSVPLGPGPMPARLSPPLWYSSPPTSAPSSPTRTKRYSIPSARMSLMGFTRPAERVRLPSRITVRYQAAHTTPMPHRRPAPLPALEPQPEPQPEPKPPTAPEPAAWREPQPEPEPEPTPEEVSPPAIPTTP